MPASPCRRCASAASRLARSSHRLGELGARRDGVDEPPLDGALALDALGERGEDVGEVAPHLRLSTTRVSPPVPGSTPSSGTSGSDTADDAVVDEQDLVARQRQLVAAAGRRRRCTPRASAAREFARRVLERQPRLVGELAEVDLERVRRAASMWMFAPAQKMRSLPLT